MTKDIKLGKFIDKVGDAVRFANSQFSAYMKNEYPACESPFYRVPRPVKAAAKYPIDLLVGLAFDGDIGLGG